MTYDEYKEKIDNILTNPDTALGEIGAVYDELEKDLTTLDSVTAENERLMGQVNELRETNIKLYLQTTGAATEESGTESEEDEEEKSVDEFFEDLMEG